MRADIHPKYEPINVTCSCGNTFETRSALCKDLSVDICSQCHPFYTGNQKIIDSGGRVERFMKKFGKTSIKKETPKDSE